MKKGKLNSCQEEEDRISSLPDSVIQRILSFVPCTQQAFRTSFLSKRWLYQWTHVPNLMFHLRPNCDCQHQDFGGFLKFIEGALVLNSCSEINKFDIQLHNFGHCYSIPQLPLWLHFAARKEAKEITIGLLDVTCSQLPQFFFHNDSVVKLKIIGCSFLPKGNVNWKWLRVLIMYFVFDLTNEVMQNVISGSPSLESLELHDCDSFDRYDTASKCLKRLVVCDTNDNLERLSDVLTISSPFLEKLELLGNLHFKQLNLMNLPSLVCATLDLCLLDYFEDEHDGDGFNVSRMYFVKETLPQVQQVEELKLGSCFIRVLSFMEVKGLPSPILNCKSLTVYAPCSSVDLPGIAILIRSLPRLEKLIIKFRGGESCQGCIFREFRGFSQMAKMHWMSYKTASKPLSHLKNVEIIGLVSEHGEYDLVLQFVEFLLKNALVLESMIIEERTGRTDFMLAVSRKLLGMRRSSPNSIVKF